jgi:hypothetical protein
LGQTEIVESKKGERMQSVDFHMQMDCETGVPEFFLAEPDGHNPPHDVAHVRECLEFMLGQLRFFESSAQEKEYDLDTYELDLVFWELEPEDDEYETKTVERIAITIVEVEYQLEVLADLENQVQMQVLLNTRQQMPHDWKEDGF